MAIYKDIEAINPIESIDEKWEGKTGKEVEDFISRRLKNPLGSIIDYAGETLSIRNPEGDIIASCKVLLKFRFHNSLSMDLVMIIMWK